MFLLLILMVFGCSEEPVIKNTDPANLRVEITADENGDVSILASAENTAEYQLRIGNAEQPNQSNTTGIFYHTFTQSGTYALDIRAVGSTGRYLREVFQINVAIVQQEVPVDHGFFSPLSYDGYSLMWQDEFNSNAVDTDNWVFENGTGCPNLCGWGNNELQYYRKENAWVDGGVLTIEARKENYLGSLYTSTRMKTQGKKSFRYGRVDIRALMPVGQGLWPALWMLGNNITTVGWPRCGEIDIMEMVGGNGRENTTHGTLHWDNNGHAYTGGSFTLSQGNFNQKYHVFSIVWDETAIRWLVDNVQFHQINITPAHMNEFHEEFFFIFNVAVGGNWPGNPNQSTIFPQQMKVDYIRVFQKN
jgi:hypothetical protein